MKTRFVVDDLEYTLTLSTEHAASSYGQPVLVDTETGEAIDQFSAGLHRVLEATPEELDAAKAAGYVFAGEV
jgi:hypothetical protein